MSLQALPVHNQRAGHDRRDRATAYYFLGKILFGLFILLGRAGASGRFHDLRKGSQFWWISTMGCSSSTTRNNNAARGRKVGAIDNEFEFCPTAMLEKLSPRKIRTLRWESWKKILMDFEIAKDGQVLAGMNLFSRDFNFANDLLGSNKLHINRCRVSPSHTDSVKLILFNIMRRLVGVHCDVHHEMDTFRSLGRKHALVGKQDRLATLFQLLMATISKRLPCSTADIGTNTTNEDTLMAWRYHFDILRRAMTRDQLTLYPELHSQRVSSSYHSKQDSSSDISSSEYESLGAYALNFDDKDARYDLLRSCTRSNSHGDTMKHGPGGQSVMSSEAEELLTKAVQEFDANLGNKISISVPNFILVEAHENNEVKCEEKLASSSYETAPASLN